MKQAMPGVIIDTRTKHDYRDYQIKTLSKLLADEIKIKCWLYKMCSYFV